jgi:UDP-glucose 4-epimerase
MSLHPRCTEKHRPALRRCRDTMRILVTGARGKVGAAAIHRLLRSRSQSDRGRHPPPVYERAREVRYVQVDLGRRRSRRCGRARPRRHRARCRDREPVKDPPHVIFQSNVMSTYNVIEAAEGPGIGRVVQLSSSGC